MATKKPIYTEVMNSSWCDFVWEELTNNNYVELLVDKRFVYVFIIVLMIMITTAFISDHWYFIEGNYC